MYGFFDYVWLGFGVILLFLIVRTIKRLFSNNENEDHDLEKERQREKALEELNRQNNSLIMWSLILIGISLLLSLSLTTGLLFVILGVLVGIYNKI